MRSSDKSQERTGLLEIARKVYLELAVSNLRKLSKYLFYVDPSCSITLTRVESLTFLMLSVEIHFLLLHPRKKKGFLDPLWKTPDVPSPGCIIKGVRFHLSLLSIDSF